MIPRVVIRGREREGQGQRMEGNMNGDGLCLRNEKWHLRLSEHSHRDRECTERAVIDRAGSKRLYRVKLSLLCEAIIKLEGLFAS